MSYKSRGRRFVNLDNNRETFGSRLGFILSCVGSAVGMGNIWLFPYRIGEFGGAAFLIPYLIFVAVIGYTGVVGEMAFGREMGTGPLGAFDKAFKMKGKNYGKLIGTIPVLGSLSIGMGYSVVVGWILKYLMDSISGNLLKNADPSQYFQAISGNYASITWHLLGLIVLFFILIFGVSRGIEKINKIMMPSFFILFMILAIRVSLLNGAMEGYKYIFLPRWEALMNFKTWVYALGQAFFSLSLAGSGTIVYGSYLNKSEDILHSAKYVVIFDTLAAILAALVIIPAVFAYGLDPTAGPALMFITLPSIFKQMPFGNIFAIAFFLAVFFAAITSLINLMETPIEALQEKYRLSRFASVILVLGISASVGVFIENVEIVSRWMDFVSIYIIPLGAILAAISFYWVCGTKFAKYAVQQGRDKIIGSWFEPMTRYVFVGLSLFVYIMGIIYGGIG